jgi:hypothetical protein
MAALLCCPAATAAQQGYTISNNRILVQTADHWQGWDIAVGAATIGDDGSVTPRFIRKRVNASLEAPLYDSGSPGGAFAVSNAQDTHLVIDDDRTTFWQPDLDDPADDWWIELRLGRVVVVDSVVLWFVDEGLGEPFLQFEVNGWRRAPPLDPDKYFLLGTEVPAYWTIFRTDRPNKTQRRFQFVPRTTEPANAAFSGDAIERLLIQVTDSERSRLREVSATVYASLPDVARGSTEYYRVSGTGRQTLTTNASYDLLPPEAQGPVRYFQRERPRLAEVQVWTEGDNLNLGQVARGGSNTIESRTSVRGPADISTSVTDGSPSSGPTVGAGSANVTYEEDLGTKFWIETIDLLFDGRVSRLLLDVSDGSLAPDGSLSWKRLDSGFNPGSFFRFRTDPIKIRHFRFQHPTQSGNSQFSLLEVMLYGAGYAAEAVLTSPIIDLGGRKGLNSIEWDALTPEGTWVEITSRTGNTLSEAYIYHDNYDNIVTKERFDRFPEVKKGEIFAYAVAGADFSPWSISYVKSGDEIRSPRTRRYLQLQVRVVADTVSKHGPPAQLYSIRVNMSDLYTDELLSEIWPPHVEHIGEPEPRTFFLRPIFGNSAQGFDLIRVVASSPTHLALVGISVGAERDFKSGVELVIPASEIERIPSGADTLLLRLPQKLRKGVDHVEVRMATTVYSNSASFEVAIRDANYLGAWQMSEVGEVDGRIGETDVAVALSGNRVLSRLRVEPPVVTPNGDAVNDEATILFELSRLLGPKDLTLTVYDLTGRAVRHLRQHRPDSRGDYVVPWDATDDDGAHLPPGIYLIRLAVVAESGRANGTIRTSTICVAY